MPSLPKIIYIYIYYPFSQLSWFVVVMSGPVREIMLLCARCWQFVMVQRFIYRPLDVHTGVEGRFPNHFSA